MIVELPAYPGRAIAVHRHHDGHLEWIYALTGRSEASRARTGRIWHALDPDLRVALAVGIVADAVPTRVLTERPSPSS